LTRHSAVDAIEFAFRRVQARWDLSYRPHHA
jgi:hypothetical protein